MFTRINHYIFKQAASSISITPLWKLLLCYSICIVTVKNSIAQSTAEPGFGMEMNIMAGKVVKHSAKFTLPIPSLSGAAEVNFLWKTYGKKDWQRRRKYPTLGIGIAYTNYGNDKIYGQSIGIYPNLELPIYRSPKLEWTMRLGMGLGYISKRYSRTAPTWDTLNVAIGSHINNYTLFTSDLRYKVNSHWSLQAGINFSHMSDAAYRKPNLGINLVGAHIGVRYFPNTSNPKRTTTTPIKLRNRWLIQARQGIAMTSSGSGGGPVYPVYLSSLYMSKRYHTNNKFFAGVDYSYHHDIYAFLKNYDLTPGKERQQSWKSAIFVGNEFIFGHVGLLLQVGVYTHEAYLKLDPYYEKFGMNWYLLQREKGFLKEIFIATLLKTHLTQAELAELGLGIGF